MRTIGLLLAAGLSLTSATAGAAAAQAQLPEAPWPRAMACMAHLYVVIDKMETEGVQTEEGQAGLEMMDLSAIFWGTQAVGMAEYTDERAEQDIAAYLAGPLGSGPEAFDSSTRLANLEACVNEAISRGAPPE
ncbi:MAG TPA: hypothetical protein VF138_01345 [Caulobacteraceae bacterium]